MAVDAPSTATGRGGRWAEASVGQGSHDSLNSEAAEARPAAVAAMISV
jgi:hypothetical protein